MPYSTACGTPISNFEAGIHQISYSKIRLSCIVNFRGKCLVSVEPWTFHSMTAFAPFFRSLTSHNHKYHIICTYIVMQDLIIRMSVILHVW